MTSLLAWFRRGPRVSPKHARRRAARGAAYLDEVDPGWHRRLDLGALALDDGASCVLGQLHGSFRDGVGRARLFQPGSAPRASLSPVAYGFHCVHAGDEETERRDYALLNAAWQEEVRRRQQQDHYQRTYRSASATRRQTRPGTRPQVRRQAPSESALPSMPV